MNDNKETEYSINLKKNKKPISSAELSKKDALIFIKAANHLINYLTETMEERK